MAVRSSGILGSTLAAALLGTFLYHSMGMSGPARGAESNQPKRTLSAVTEPAKKGSTEPRSSAKGQEIGIERAKGPWIASREHFAGRCSCFSGTESANDKDQTVFKAPCRSESGAGNDLRLWCIPQNEHVKAMIAIIPDPVHSHLALRFDRAIDAIELAAESMHYVLDRYWLPWDLDPKMDWFDYESFQAAKKDRDQKEREPGLLMFRWDGKPETAPSTVLYVFLVGETPTAGLNGDQFVQAVKDVDSLNDDLASPGKTAETYILGPTFSASFASLAGLIEEPTKTFFIHATARNSLAIPAICDNRRQFSTFITPVPDATYALIQRLAIDHAVDNTHAEKAGKDQNTVNQVAILSEASTTLGASLDNDLKGEDCNKVVKSDDSFDIFWYPREIASLRNAYAVSSVQSPATQNSTAGPWPSLSLNLTNIVNQSDEPPDFSKAQSPLSQEAALMGFAEEMKRKHYRYIGTNASNTLDVVFLESFLRRAVPNARLFSFDSDLLLEHEPDNIPYIGTLSVATYPLLYPPLNQIGNQKSGVDPAGVRRRLPFTSQREEGLYNATICTVRDMLKPGDLGILSELKACPELESHGCAAHQATLPLWLTVFGAGGHWPIEVLVPRERLPEVLRPDLKKLQLPFLWKAVCTLLCALAGLHISVLFGLAPFSAKFRDFKLESVAPARQLLGIHMASATLALALALVGLSAWTLNRWSVFSILFSGLLLIPCRLLTGKYFRWWEVDESKAPEDRYLRPRPRRRTIVSQGLVFSSIWLGAAGLAYMWWNLLNEPDGRYGDFFSLRALHLTSIVSPLAPVLPLLASIYIGAIFYVWHLLFNDKIRPRLNPSWDTSPIENKRAWLHHFFFYDEEQPELEPGGEQSGAERKLRPGLRSEPLIAKAVNEDVWSVIIGVVILVLWLWVFSQPQFELFERPWFQLLFEILFGLVMLLILVSGFRLGRIWQKLRRFLQDLNRQRVKRVFAQLKLDGGWAALWFYGSEAPDWDYMKQSHEVLQDLWNTPAKPAGSEAVDTAIKNIHKTKEQLQREPFSIFHRIKVVESDAELEKAMSRGQDQLALVLNQVLDQLGEFWRDPFPPNHPAIQRRRLLEKYVALRWFSFIRAVIARIRLLILFLTIGFSLAMISLVIYSFEPHQELLWSVTALFIVIGLLVLTVLVQMHRDPILSRIVGTEPGKLDLTFFVRLILLGVGPMLTLLATHFPSIGQSVISFLQPGLEAMK